MYCGCRTTPAGWMAEQSSMECRSKPRIDSGCAMTEGRRGSKDDETPIARNQNLLRVPSGSCRGPLRILQCRGIMSVLYSRHWGQSSVEYPQSAFVFDVMPMKGTTVGRGCCDLASHRSRRLTSDQVNHLDSSRENQLYTLVACMHGLESNVNECVAISLQGANSYFCVLAFLRS